MEFTKVLRKVTRRLETGGHRHALIGGHGLAAYGRARATLDLDLLVDGEAQAEVVEMMEALGYETLYRSAGYSNHLHSDRGLGRVDFVYVGGETADRVFASARRMPGPGGLDILVPKPEHLVAMKVQAMKNDPDRTLQDMADIRYLLSVGGVDRGEVEGYFRRQGLEEKLDELG